MAKGRVFYKGSQSFIHEASGTLIKPGLNEIEDAKVAQAIREDHEGCYAEEPEDDGGAASERMAAAEPEDSEGPADEEDAPRGKGRTARKK